MRSRSIFTLAVVGLLVAAFAFEAEAQDKKKRRGVRGKVKSVDAEAGTITVTVRVKKESADKTYKVAKNAKVSINGEEKTLGDVKAGLVVSLRLGEGDEVTAIVAGRKKKKKE